MLIYFFQNGKSLLLFQVPTPQPALKHWLMTHYGPPIQTHSLPFVILLTFPRSSLFLPSTHRQVWFRDSKWKGKMATNVKCNSDSYRQSTKRAKLLKISFSLPFHLLGCTLCATKIRPLEVMLSGTTWDIALFLQMWIYVEQDLQIACLVLVIGRKDLLSPVLLLLKKGGRNRKKRAHYL